MMEQKNIIVGIDMGEKQSQICVFDHGRRDAVSVPVDGEETLYPTVLARLKEDWICGKGAVLESGVIVIDHLLEIFHSSRPFRVEEQEYTPGELLTEFLRASLRLAGITEPGRQISCMMVTARQLSRAFVENLRYAYTALGLPRGRAYLQDYTESFYYHTLCQRPELYSRSVGLFCLEEGHASFQSLSISRKTKPAVVSVKKGPQAALTGEKQERDQRLLRLAKEAIGLEIYSSVYLVGEDFLQEDFPESLRFLGGNHRRLFGGDNLFARGACWAAREKVEERMLKGYLFLGNDLIRYNIGMEMIISGSPAYYPLIVAGVNWYDAEKECEFLLDGVDELVFVVSAMENGRRSRYTMKLPGLPERPPRTTRIRLHLEYDSPVLCRITAEDLGFGDLFPSSGKVWHETMGEVQRS